MLSPSPVILIPQSREKNLRSSLRVNSAKHLCSLWDAAERKNNCRDSSPRQVGAQNDRSD
jgi:hypothetical protein